MAQAPPAGMALIPAGWFLMGSNRGDPDERPVHRVWLDAFYIDKHEVTNAQYARYLNATGSKMRRRWLLFPDLGLTLHRGRYQAKPGMERLPVVYLGWRSAAKYCSWRGMSLPSEAQWEKACRGGLTGKRYPLGDGLQRRQANVHRWWRPRPDPVGSYPPNGYGLHDMAGNVGEFCQDTYCARFYRSSPSRNPICHFTPKRNRIRRVVRGGDFGLPRRLARCAQRRFMNQSQQDLNNFTGFRCACRPPCRGGGRR